MCVCTELSFSWCVFFLVYLADCVRVWADKYVSMLKQAFLKSSLSTPAMRSNSHTHTHTQHLQPIHWALAISQVQMKTSNSSSVSSWLPDVIRVTQLSLSLSAIHTQDSRETEGGSSLWFLLEISRSRRTKAEPIRDRKKEKEWTLSNDVVSERSEEEEGTDRDKGKQKYTEIELLMSDVVSETLVSS